MLIANAGIIGLSAQVVHARELSTSDFRFDGPFGSEDAVIERVGTNHFKVVLGHAPEHPTWCNMLQFQILRNAKGNRLRLDVYFYGGDAYRFNHYSHSSWSYDGINWQPIKWQKETKESRKGDTLLFPEFEENTVYFGHQVPMSYENVVEMMEKWNKHPHASVHTLGKSLGGRNIYRLEITNPQSLYPRNQRWVHYFGNQHPGEHNAQWRMVGMIEWLLSDAGTDCRRRSISHFILMMYPDGPSHGWYRVGLQGVDGNRSYLVTGADKEKQAHEAYITQKDLEELMVSEAPVTDLWSMHTWGGIVEPIMHPGPEMGTVLPSWTKLKNTIKQNDPDQLVKPLAVREEPDNTTQWNSGPHVQFGITTVLCEGAGNIITKKDNMASGAVLMKSLARYYQGTKEAVETTTSDTSVAAVPTEQPRNTGAPLTSTSNTDWFKDARYGVFVHFLPWNPESLFLVEQFDVHALARQLESIGANYLVLTLGQNSGYMNSPNATYNQYTGYVPGQRCAVRDLPLDLYRALHPHGIRLMLYLPCQVPNRDARAQKAFGLAQGKKDQPIDEAFARKWAEVIYEWSSRYGQKVSGWWFDGGYRHIHFNEAIARIYADAVKRGNPKAIVTFNPGVKLIRYTQAEDYTAGELTEPFEFLPASRWVEGSQWHALTYLGSRWSARDTRYPAGQWAKWINAVVAKDGVVTLDMGPNWDPQVGPIGSLSDVQIEQVKRIRASLAEDSLSKRALYEIVLPENPHPKQIATLEIVEAPSPDDPNCNWYRLKGTKVNGDSYSIWCLATANPFTASPEVAFHRYILQEQNQGAIEYIDQRTQKALLPVFHFRKELLPHTDSQAFPFERGTYLGHRLRLKQKSPPATPILPLPQVTRHVFRTDLTIATARNFRDDGTGRKSKKDNYTYVPFTPADYDTMIAAGINYFKPRGEQTDWICRRAVFYEGYNSDIAFPEELYRPNFLGVQMYIDEPACRLAGKYPNNAPLAKAIEMIHEHIRQKIGNGVYRNILTQNGIDPGALDLTEPAFPLWETYVGTSYYQLEANPGGFIQECRWHIDPNADSQQILMLQRINEEFGVDIPITPKNLFTWFYAQMRGPARVFNTKWGISIYGQAEPHLRLPSMKLAYDWGAEYIWLWTSDHDHHVPYSEQLALARQISEYAKAHQRTDLDKLRRAASTAIVLPYGYTLPSCWQLHTWGTHIYPLSRKNPLGLTYKQVLTPAIREITRCLKNNVAYDVVPAGKQFDPSGYKQVIWIGEDGTVRILSNGDTSVQ
jgi:hypothetical protein